MSGGRQVTAPNIIKQGTMKKSIMSENDYSSIFSCLEKRKEIKKIKTYQNFDIDDLFDDDSDDTKKIDKERTGTPDYTVEDISDFHLDIRYVIVLRKDGAVIRIAYGICSNIVKIDGRILVDDNDVVRHNHTINPGVSYYLGF